MTVPRSVVESSRPEDLAQSASQLVAKLAQLDQAIAAQHCEPPGGAAERNRAGPSGTRCRPATGIAECVAPMLLAGVFVIASLMAGRYSERLIYIADGAPAAAVFAATAAVVGLIVLVN